MVVLDYYYCVAIGVLSSSGGDNEEPTEVASENAAVADADKQTEEKTEDVATEEPTEKPTTEPKIILNKYYIVEKQDFPFADAVRYNWEVVVEGKVTVTQLTEISRLIIENAKEELQFNALSIHFYDYEEFIGDAYTLGQVTFAPDGDWSKADTVQIGQYDKMKYNFDLREKDWEKQLTKEEVEIYKASHDLYYSKVTDTTLPDDTEIEEEIAKQFNISQEKVHEIRLKHVSWIFNDISQ